MKLNVQDTLYKYSKNIAHAKEVERLSLMFFQEINDSLSCINDNELKYLQAGALLHDIGYFISKKNHNKHSMDIILNDGLLDFDERETKIVACICRYHKGSLPDKHEHKIYNSLDKKDRKTVKQLGGIVRLCDGLDKLHKPIIENINIELNSEYSVAKITIFHSGDKLDLLPAICKRNLFEVAFKCQSFLVCRQNNSL